MSEPIHRGPIRRMESNGPNFQQVSRPTSGQLWPKAKPVYDRRKYPDAIRILFIPLNRLWDKILDHMGR